MLIVILVDNPSQILVLDMMPDLGDGAVAVMSKQLMRVGKRNRVFDFIALGARALVLDRERCSRVGLLIVGGHAYPVFRCCCSMATSKGAPR